MKVKDVCKTEHPVAMPGQKAKDEGESKGTGQAGAGETEVKDVAPGVLR